MIYEILDNVYFYICFWWFSLNYIFVFYFIKKEITKLGKNKKLGQAEITMWVAEEGSYYYHCGKIIGITNQTAWSIHDSSGKGYMSYKYKEKYPVGSIIDVEYAEYKHMGCKKFIDIRYIDKE